MYTVISEFGNSFLLRGKKKKDCFGPSFISKTFETVSKLLKSIGKAGVSKGPQKKTGHAALYKVRLVEERKDEK